MQHVVLFGLSANPPTGLGGHAGIVSWAATRDGVDQVWVLPVYKHAFAEKRGMVPFEHRLAMAELAFGSLPGLSGKVRVLDTERRVWEATRMADPAVEPFIGTIDVLRALSAESPGTRFSLLLGADTYKDLLSDRWKESAALKALVSLLVLPRKGVAAVKGSVDEDPGLSDVSSSALRASRDPAFWAAHVQPAVLAYIRAHRLYGLA